MDAAATNAGTAADDRPHHTAAASAGPDDAAEVPDDVPAAALDDTVQRAAGMSEQQEAPRVVPKWIGVVGLFIAPTTVITSLCYFYGYVATRKYFAYFGIDTDAIGFTTSDYVMRSVRALYVPVIAGLLTYAALLWAGAYLRRLVQSGRRTRLARTLGWAAVAVGAVSMAWAILSLTRPQWALVHVDVLTPVALGLGAALIGGGVVDADVVRGACRRQGRWPPRNGPALWSLPVRSFWRSFGSPISSPSPTVKTRPQSRTLDCGRRRTVLFSMRTRGCTCPSRRSRSK